MKGSGRVIVWTLCDCYAWPVDPYAPVGPCGRCRTQPRPVDAATRAEAEAIYTERHGHPPEPIGPRR